MYRLIWIALLVVGVLAASTASAEPSPVFGDYSLFEDAEAEGGDQFGVDIAIDGGWMAIGAPGWNPDDNVAKVFLYRWDDQAGEWTLHKKWEKTNKFGEQIELEAGRLVVISQYENEGTGYVYEKDAGGVDNWGLVGRSQLSPINRSGNIKMAASGDFVALATVNYSPRDTLTFYDISDPNAWELLNTHVGPDTQSSFGMDVAMDGDIAVSSDPFADGTGRVYVYGRNEGGTDNWGEVTSFAPGDAAQGDSFGTALALDGDRLIVTSRSTVWARDYGSVYVFERASNGSWSQVAKVRGTDDYSSSNFGSALAVSQDRFLVSASSAGRVYVYAKTDSSEWSDVCRFEPDIETGALFARGLALDTYRAAAGTPSKDNTETGYAMAFDLPDVGVADEVTLDEDEPADIDVLANDPVDDVIELVTMPEHGTASVQDGKIHYVPEPGYNGEDTLTYALGGTSGCFAEVPVTLTVESVNDAPIAEDDAVTTDYEEGVDIDVRANDSDPDGDYLSVTMVGQPQHGEASVMSDRIHYEPERDFVGTDTFTYQVDDANGGTAEATVTVQVGSGPTDNDRDGDGVEDPDDNCPASYNPDQNDRNDDGWGDVCGGIEEGHREAGDDGGCACTTTSGANGAVPGLLAAAGLVLMGLRRRRRSTS